MLLDRRRTVAAAVLLAVGCGDGNPCPESVGGLCHALHVDGIDAHGELGFRFGEPLDIDGDGAADLLAGARRTGDDDHGAAMAWTADGTLLQTWTGQGIDGLFGNIAIAVPDLDRDGQPDVVISAPNAVIDGEPRGLAEAYRLDGRRIWRAEGDVGDGLGWQIAGAGDRDGDGVEDLWIGAPSNSDSARVYLRSGSTGEIIDTISSTRNDDQFGFYLAAVDDLDGDGVADLAVGAPAASIDGIHRGAVVLISGATRRVIRELLGETAGTGFGLMIAPMDDLDDDGIGDIAVGAPGDTDPTTPAHADVQIFSGATGARLRRLASADDGDFYGKSLARLDDLDGDGVHDLAIGAPWWHGLDGRFEIRSARTFALLADVRGNEGGWLGWHLARADGGVLVSSLHLDDDRGALDLYVKH